MRSTASRFLRDMWRTLLGMGVIVGVMMLSASMLTRASTSTRECSVGSSDSAGKAPSQDERSEDLVRN